MFKNTYKGKKIFITGHTGFKGTWLTTWLLDLGAIIHGFSDKIPTQPSAFEVLDLSARITETRGDITDFGLLKSSIDEFEPDFIFHLAAQAIVSLSYADPLETIKTNVMGVSSVLEVCRTLTYKCVVVIITSDKCYENVEWEWGYKETDHLGGKDIYSGSKGAAEAIFHAYYHSFFINHSFVRIASARAGNVIGGGDWAPDRIVADCVRSWSKGEVVGVRSPKATRPWQHVLEPLSGYLSLASDLWDNESILKGHSFNFGPTTEKNRTVLNVIDGLSQHWICQHPLSNYYELTGNVPFHEAGLLKLNCDKALFHLSWEPTLTFDECIELVGVWYNDYYNKQDSDIYQLTLQQVRSYCNTATKKQVTWALTS
jgi:CDP-glucose 4,6-dehydratase